MKVFSSNYSSLSQQVQDAHEVRRSIPWSGLLCVALALGCGVAALVIGLTSDGQPLNAWTIASGYEVQPSVLLAIVATIGNAFLAYAFAEGVTLSWWAKAQRGSTLRSLQAAYLQSTSVSGLIKSLPQFSRMAVASTAMLILLMDAPLLQRASTITTYTKTTDTNLTMPISTFPLQLGATGIIGDHVDPMKPQIFHPMFAQVVRQYNSRDEINVTKTGCVGRCETEIIAPGWDVSCKNGIFPYQAFWQNEFNEYYEAMDKNKTWKGPAKTQTYFETDVTYYYDANDLPDSYGGFGSFQMILYNVYKQTAGLKGTMAWRNCTLKEALVRYPINMVNNTLTLGEMPVGENRTTQLILRQEEDSSLTSLPSTLGGIWLAVNNRYATQANVTFTGPYYRILTTNAIANTYITPSVPAFDLQTPNITWSDPMDDMLNTVNELSLRTAITMSSETPYANGVENSGTGAYSLTDAMPYIAYPNLTEVNRTLTQSVAASMSEPLTVYHTRKGWLAGGFVVMLLACLAILPTYWGFWRLHGKVSMSPLEVAKAFDAPLLRDRGFDGMKVQFGHAGLQKMDDRLGSMKSGHTKPGTDSGVDPGIPVYNQREKRGLGFQAVPQDDESMRR